MTYTVKSPRKLIEVALPLDAINAACAREKSIRHGHPSTLHLWWARRPLAAARAVLFAQLVNDPGFQRGGGFRYGKNKKEAAVERQRLFKILEDLVLWDNTRNEEVLERARAEIRRSWREVCELNKDHPRAAEEFNPDRLPPFHDPFAGGATIPLEAQRLGLNTHASDLNPVAVLISKATIEIPARFEGSRPVGPDANTKRAKRLSLSGDWPATTGLAEDIRRYGDLMQIRARERLGSLYSKVEVTRRMAANRPELETYVGKRLTVLAWLWTRTVQCPNPACAAEMPLLSSLVLASKPGKEAYLNPIVEGKRVRFSIQSEAPRSVEDPKKGFKRGISGIFECAVCETVTTRDYVAEQAMAHGLGTMQTAVVAEGERARVYLPPEVSLLPPGIPQVESPALDIELAPNPRDVWCRNFGLLRPRDLFTPRQLASLRALCEIVGDVQRQVLKDAIAQGFLNDERPLRSGGSGALAYSEGVATFLAFVVEKMTEAHSTLCTWSSAPKNELVVSTFRRHALPMTWDFAEANPMADSSGSLSKTVDAVARVVDMALVACPEGQVQQLDACSQSLSGGKVVSTDPPYYDNVGYADLSDYFYAWLRQTLRTTYPDLFSTLAAPRSEELVAAAYRQGGKEEAETFFLEGMTKAMARIADQTHEAFPVTIYYAFKQSETESDVGTASTGWETFLDAVIRAGFAISGTWPMRTEREARSISIGTNSLASSVVLVCRRREKSAPTVSRRDFLRDLNAALPEALDEMTSGAGDDRAAIAPVDLSQAVIGPGMAIFSKFHAVLEADGTPMSVRTALQLINRFLAEDDFDADTQFCLRWFEQCRWGEGRFGDADTLSRAKGTSVEGVRSSRVLESGGGFVRLIRWTDYPVKWDPATDSRNPVWETLHHLIRALKADGESGAGRLLAAVKGNAEPARQLAYRLYTLCERKGWTEEARIYNEIITSWSGIETAAGTASSEPVQGKLFD